MTRMRLELAAAGQALLDPATAAETLAALAGLTFTDPRVPAILAVMRNRLDHGQDLDPGAVAAELHLPAPFAFTADAIDAARNCAGMAVDELLELAQQQPAPPAALLRCSDYTPTDPLHLPEHVVPGMLRGAVSFLHGAEGVGKTALAFQLAVAYATGGTWLHQTMERRGRVLFLAQEMGRAELQARSVVLSQLHGFTLQDLSANLAVVTEEELEGRYLNMERDGHLLEATVAQLHAELVVVDHLSALSADERDSGQTIVVEQLHRLAIRTGAALLVLDHDNKAGFTERGAHAGRALKRRTAAATYWLSTERGVPYLDVGKARYLAADDRGRLWLAWRSMPDPWGRTRSGRPVSWGHLELATTTPPHRNGHGRLLDLVGLVGESWTPTRDVLDRVEAAALYPDLDGDTLARTVRRDLVRLAGDGQLERQAGAGRQAAQWRRATA